MTHNRQRAPLPFSSHPFFFLVAVTFCLLATRLSGRGETILDMTAESHVSASEILLKDIVRHPAALPADWGHRRVLESPRPGQAAEYPLVIIAFALQQYPDMLNVTLRGQTNLRVERSGASLPPDFLHEAIRKYVADQPDFAGKEFNIVFDPIAHTDMSIEPVKTAILLHKPLDESGRYSFEAVITGSKQEEKRVTATAVLLPLRKVWAARNHLKRGHTLADDDLELISASTGAPGDFLKPEELVAGMELNRSFRAGEPIVREALLDIPCAERGDTISVNVERGNLRVSLKAKALMPGRRGERIVCLNEQSKRRLNVMLTAPKEAIVETGASL